MSAWLVRVLEEPGRPAALIAALGTGLGICHASGLFGACDAGAPSVDAAVGVADTDAGDASPHQDADASVGAGFDVAEHGAAGDAHVAAPDVAGPSDAGPPVDVPVAPDVTSTQPEEASTGYPASGLLVRIVAPSGRPTAAVTGSKVTIKGVLFGDAETVTWAHAAGASGDVSPGVFWTTGAVDLLPGDNVITVTASGDAGVTSDTVVLTYNPAFRFDAAPLARPDLVWMDSPRTIVFTVPASLYPGFDPDTVTLHEVNAQGTSTAVIGQMRDLGDPGATADEIEGDGVFTIATVVGCGPDGHRRFRASVEVAGDPVPFVAWSETIPVWCLERFTPTHCQSHRAILEAAELLASSGLGPAEVATELLADPSVADAGVSAGDGHNVWVRFSSGALGAVLIGPSDLRGGAGASSAQVAGGPTVSLGSRKALILAPFATQFGPTDDAPAVAAALDAHDCPAWTVAGGGVIGGQAANLDRFRTLADYGLVSISTHGDAMFGELSPSLQADVYQWRHVGPQEVLWTGEPVGCGQLQTKDTVCAVTNDNPTGSCPVGTRCLVTSGSGGNYSTGICVDRTQADIRMGRVVLTNRGYAVTPAFFDAWAGRSLPSGLVNLGACRTMFNGSLAATLFARGAATITGFSDYVHSAWARDQVVELFEGALELGQPGLAHLGGADPLLPSGRWRLFGAPNLDLAASGLINGSFETGDTTGWTRAGDGRVVTHLGSSQPVQGKFAGLVSTGLGFTVASGLLEQAFCIPEDRHTLELYWRFYSEEFTEYCGTEFQDSFQAVLQGNGGQLAVIDVRIDDLCHYTAGSCGECEAPIACDAECMGADGCQLDADGLACVGEYPCTCGR